MKDYYFILGVAPNAGNVEIKEAFRTLCLKYHPDRTVSTPHNHERYMDICEAYRVLSSKTKRKSYDNTLLKDKREREPLGILPEIKTAYKGHYPWLAVFAVLIVAAVSVYFLYNTDNGIYTGNTIATNIVQDVPSPRPMVSAPVADTTVDTVVATAPVIDTALAAGIPDPIVDSATRMQQFITSTLAQHTVNPNRNKFPTRERNYQYSFKGEKLFVTYDQPLKIGRPIRKQIAIPVNGIKSIYYYAGQLWITGSAIQVKDLHSGKREQTDFFSVRFDTGGGENIEQKLAAAFAQLKTM